LSAYVPSNETKSLPLGLAPHVIFSISTDFSFSAKSLLNQHSETYTFGPLQLYDCKSCVLNEAGINYQLRSHSIKDMIAPT